MMTWFPSGSVTRATRSPHGWSLRIFEDASGCRTHILAI